MFAREFLDGSPAVSLAVVALLIFAVVFTTVTIRALLMDKDEIEALARMPLEDARTAKTNARKEEDRG
ncbi:MAG: hypothetical protein GXP55_24755 [Deltaproteobacteria bacterium]|nr:hypothetical protein [Deltaproteobacteria bacterium]